MITYIIGDRVAPEPLNTTLSEQYRVVQNNKADKSRHKNMIWLLSRQVNTENQEVPIWTGFNIKTRDLVEITQGVLGYLPAINTPATELKSV